MTKNLLIKSITLTGGKEYVKYAYTTSDAFKILVNRIRFNLSQRFAKAN